MGLENTLLLTERANLQGERTRNAWSHHDKLVYTNNPLEANPIRRFGPDTAGTCADSGQFPQNSVRDFEKRAAKQSSKFRSVDASSWSWEKPKWQNPQRLACRQLASCPVDQILRLFCGILAGQDRRLLVHV